jgi:predicted AlkP superfamily pyrophosphatase or phosphodiesterase
VSLGLLGLTIASAGCGASIVNAPRSTAPPPPSAASSRLTEHVVLISIDGLRPDAIAQFGASTMQRLIAEGSHTLSAQTVLPSKTLPSHTSMLTGEPPERHGVLWNTAFEDRPGTLEIPTVFGLARRTGYQTAAFFSKAKFSHLQQPGTLDYSQAPGGWFGKWRADRTARDVVTYLHQTQPNLLFVHLPDPDLAGHSNGWMSADYGRAVQRADAAVARIIKAADAAYGTGGYTLIVTADHGGRDKDHGSDDALDTHIPWIAWGRAVQPGVLLDASVRTTDTASTVLFLLGVDSPPGWQGKPVAAAFASAVRSAQ